jgi:hypothetical protein
LFIFFSKADANKIRPQMNITMACVAKSLKIIGGFMKAIILSSLLFLAACATKETNEKVDERVDKQETQAAVDSREAHDTILQSPGLSSVEKEKLQGIYEKSFSQAAKIRQQVGKNKAALFDALTDENAKKGEVNALKRRIIDLERKHVDLMFKSLEDVASIVGKNPQAMNHYREHFMENDDEEGQRLR